MRTTYERATKNHLTLLDPAADLVQISRARHGKKNYCTVLLYNCALVRIVRALYRTCTILSRDSPSRFLLQLFKYGMFIDNFRRRDRTLDTQINF